MARQTRAKLDRKGLAGLGLDKLVDILLEEAGANKALKARLQTALAGGAGTEEMARLIDKRLDQIEQAETRITSARAKDLVTEFSGLVRNIVSELGAADAVGAAERILRFLSLRLSVEARLVKDSARLAKLFDDTEAAAIPVIRELAFADQVKIVPMLEKLRRADRYGEHMAFLYELVPLLSAEANAVWQVLLTAVLPSEAGRLGAVSLLQAIAAHTGDIDTFLLLEKRKPENRRDTLVAARLLHDAGRHEEALEWIRIRPPQMRILSVNGIMASVGPDYEARERRVLEADILERLKRRGDAQELRWREFTETLDPATLKLYLSKLDDFQEFEELDRALAVVTAAQDIYSALEFLIAWPRLELAAAHVMRHATAWDGRHGDVLLPAADVLADQQPLASTVLYRVLVSDIVKRSLTDFYPLAARYVGELVRLVGKLPADTPIRSHGTFMEELRLLHPRKTQFWALLA